ncbi:MULTISPECIES: BREX-1 system phosphatase PglZ type A [Clostridium]|uniref:PglZ domain-containing protein n=1 Tax=Clostridium carnis TaxID=1530 RepID=A0ABY6SYW0_9CLOT|nr:BREX-1 system phosphatase PglZ type A [Clostridium carnis]CAI3582181.1 PglZ domain-containing protein [Clostridium neonatale]CAI3585348.1 PglZ domain-containing protein [Clostridium neonatale]CAI3614221.1 PglZ domain-containing protein [Clostridium neonatale]CAI3629169.1 PglZ domain-containing protein [Clostridium neonatale]CAI3683945.1 PglZ domain-containing protein [Clostridium neonatale]
MDIETVMQDLNRRFAVPLPEFYKRRIIFWYDEDKEFEDKLDDIILDNAKLVVLTGKNNFEVKKLLSFDDMAGNYLVYNQISYDKPDDNWLLDIELYSEEFRADLISIWMDEMNITSTTALRKQVKNYRKFFNAKDRRAKIIAQTKDITTPAHLHMAVMAAVCGLKYAQPNAIIRAVFNAGLDIDTNDIYQNMVNYNIDNAFWAMVMQGSGYSEEEVDLGRLAAHMLLTATTRTMKLEHLAGLDVFISSAHQAYCYDFISEWLHSEDSKELYDIARYVEDEGRLPQRFAKLSVDDLVNTECFPCINECILTKLMTEISEHIIDVDTIASTVEKRRTCVWYDEVQNFYEGILQVANMQDFYKKHSVGFHTVEPSKVWNEYTEEYYKMDTYYRLFHLSFNKSLKVYNSALHDLFNHVMEKVEGLYTHWFLGELGKNWSDACADELREYGHILDIPQQEDFYCSKVENAGTKIFVIISDALRYEVAATLAEQLRRETQSKVELNSCESIFPTITKFGMAALLPHKELTAELKNNKLSVLADGQYTDSNYRDKILKQANSESIVLRYADIIGMKRSERSALVKGKAVVYIYHDTVDSASHTSDSMVFSACDDAIAEIKNLVRIIVNEFGGINTIITADHGFLYTYSPLKEDDKVDKTSFNQQDVEYGRRYAIMQKGAKPDYLLPVKFLNDNTDFDAFAPRESIRIKMNGGGLNFVHGGISLQEMVVPIIEYHYLRNDSKEYKKNKDKYDTKPVEVNLLSASRKISNMIFSLNFYQKEAVSHNREAATYVLYFTDNNGKQISDIQKIIADKTSDNGQERTFRCSFNLKSLKYSNTETYYLVIANESGLDIPERIEFQIDIAFAVDEFDFFS